MDIQGLTCAEAHRAVYIDFEGRQEGPPTLLGILFVSESDGAPAPVFWQHVLEPLFWGATDTRYVSGPRKRQNVRTGRPEDVLEGLHDLLEAQDRLLIAWSTRELSAINELVGTQPYFKALQARYRDGKEIAKRWKRHAYPNVVFKRTPRSGRHRLSEYFKLVGYQVPSIHSVGTTGARIAHLRAALIKREGDFNRLTRVQKAKWANLLAHNWHDCEGMRLLVTHAACELERRTQAD
jgi:hypothetical protein